MAIALKLPTSLAISWGFDNATVQILGFPVQSASITFNRRGLRLILSICNILIKYFMHYFECI